ncbi:hypothetical protein LCGC14_0372690 [marine sediment metagenome]|uniref:Uncharacterized protein n=1 Tax=marine sediment metagenome TaxID=412755 RepID=A0A0F9WDD6_9ZZZZ
MSLDPLPYKVENIVGAAKDITQYVVQIDSCKFQGSGKIRSASVMFKATDGAFITNKDFQGTDNTPIFNQFDPIQITWIDDNSNFKALIVEVDQEFGQKDPNGILLPLEFKGREAALQRRKTTAFYQFKTPNFVINDLVLRYNADRGTDEPEIFTTLLGANTNQAPDNIVNIYDFTREITYYDAIMLVITRLNQPIGTGGAGDFFTLFFDDRDILDPPNTGLILFIHIQGGLGTDTIQSTPNDPLHSLTYQIHSESGNQVFVRGQEGTGYMPVEFHEFISFVEEINNYPFYNTAVTYLSGMFVRGDDGNIYKANTAVPVSTPPPNVSFWDLETPSSIIPSSNYSPFTNNQAVVTKNSCGNATTVFANGTFNAPTFPDGNMVIREGFNSADGSFSFFRDFAMARTNDSATIPNFYFDFAGVDGFYNGLRILVDLTLGAAGGAFVGTDKFGRTFGNALVIFDGFEWIVIREFNISTDNQIGDQVVVLEEGLTYEWNVPIQDQNDFANAHTHAGFTRKFRGTGAFSTAQWRDVSDTAGGNDVFHHPKNIEVTTGLFPDDINGDDYSSFVTNSAIKITFEYTIGDEINKFLCKFTSFFDNIYNRLIDLSQDTSDIFQTLFEPTTAAVNETKVAEYYDFGWWYMLPFPYPFTKQNSSPVSVGDLYGAAPGLNQKEQFAVLDLQNANYSHSGLVGLNHTEVEDMGAPFTGIHFYFNFDIQVGGGSQPFTGDLEFIVTAYDDLSQVWRTTFTYRLLRDTQEINIPFSTFTVDRPSRTPWGLRTALQNIVIPEIEIRSIFEPKRVRFITFQLAQSYDSDLRFLAVNLDNLISLGYGLGVVTFVGIIDALTLTKQPFTSSGVITTRIINPDTIQQNNVRNLRQLRSVAVAAKDLGGLQFEEYTVVQKGRSDLTTEQTIILDDIDMIKFADVGAHTRKLILMEEDLSFNANGTKSGFISTEVLIRRLNPA